MGEFVFTIMLQGVTVTVLMVEVVMDLIDSNGKHIAIPPINHHGI